MTSGACVVALASSGWTEGQEAVLRGLRQYRDRYALPWRILNCSSLEDGDWPTDAYWVVLRPPIKRRVRLHAPRLPMLTMVGSDADDSRRCCYFDPLSFGMTALQYFIEQGYRQFGVVDLSTHPELCERRNGFVQACLDAGEQCWRFERNRAADDVDADIARQLREARADGPLALYISSDGEANWLRGLCHKQALRIPEDLAILSTGNHLSACMGDDPELSSIAFPWSVMARIVASHMHRLTQGVELEAPTMLKMFQIVERASTAQVAIPDQAVVKALRWLEAHLSHAQPLLGLVEELGLSRATICRKFKQFLGSSPKQKHEMFRLAKATRLLEQSELSMGEIAQLCGYSGQLAFGVAFKRRRGMPPGQWRAAFQD